MSISLFPRIRLREIKAFSQGKPYSVSRTAGYSGDSNIQGSIANRHAVVSCNQFHSLERTTLFAYRFFFYETEGWRQSSPVPMMAFERDTCWLCWMNTPSVLGLSPGAVTLIPSMVTPTLRPTMRCLLGLLMSFNPLNLDPLALSTVNAYIQIGTPSI